MAEYWNDLIITSSNSPLASLESTNDLPSVEASPPLTPRRTLSNLGAQTCALSPIDGSDALQHSEASHNYDCGTLPGILDESGAGGVHIKRICCIGAGYVGKSRFPWVERAVRLVFD